MILTCNIFKQFAPRNGTSCFRYLVRNMSKWSHPQEIRIPISYGYIAAKTWGKEHHEPVLALHGWQDNAGTFDRLIPLLSQDLYIVAIDAPGHGLSSHMPPDAFYHYLQNIVDIKRIVDYMKWDTFSFIGHSLGGQIALLFSSIFPNKVKNIVSLDVIKPSSYQLEELKECTSKVIEHLLQCEKKLSSEAPVYSLEDAHKRLMTGLLNQVTAEGADTLLKRGSLPSKCGKGLVFTRDIRLQIGISLQLLSHEYFKSYLKNLQCNLLIILFNETAPFFRSRSQEVLAEFINSYEETCKTFKLVEIEGKHFEHLNNPERVAPLIDAFFEENNNSELSKI